MAELKPEDVRYIIVHDTGVPVDQSAATIDRYHREERGYSQIGYHWLVRKNGDLEQGRSENIVGAHVAGKNLTIQSPNSHSIGIAMTGDQSLADTPTVQRDALVNKVAELCITYGVPPANVRGHGEVEPGNSDLSHEEMDTFRPLVEARIAEIRRERGVEAPASAAPEAPSEPPAQQPAGQAGEPPPVSQAEEPSPTPQVAEQPPAPQQEQPSGAAIGAAAGAAAAAAAVAATAGERAGTEAGTVAGTVAGTATGAAALESAQSAATLSRGATGDAVTEMQRNLKALGLDLGQFGAARDGIDGRLGPVTEAAVRAFQKSQGMPETGSASPETLAAMATAARDARGQTAGADGQTAPVGGDGASTRGMEPHPAAGAFLREADNAVSNLLDRHTQDVPGTLAGLIGATRGPGSGDLGRTTPDDVQQAFARLTAGSAALPLSRTEAGLIAGVLDERARLVAEGATPAPAAEPSGDGASGRAPIDLPVPMSTDGLGAEMRPDAAQVETVPSSVPQGGISNLSGATAEPGATALPRETGQRLPAETGPSL